VFQGIGCQFIKDDGRTYQESCATNGQLRIGFQLPDLDAPSCQFDSDCPGADLCYVENTDQFCGSATNCKCTSPDDSHWKFVVAHEAGHQLQDRATGNGPSPDYLFSCPPGMTCDQRKGEVPGLPDLLSDPPLIPATAPFCGCDHVTSANGLHCLQSIERSTSAQNEGFAQFFASRVWNTQDEADCTFVYYKEFLAPACLNDDCVMRGVFQDTTLYNNPPPVPQSCVTPHKWRNRNCAMTDANMSTEIDWMAFLYNLNSVGALRSPMTDIWRIYQYACGPELPGGTIPAPATPAKCVDSYYANWEASFKEFSAATCVVDTTCAAGEVCRDNEPGPAPCTDGTCVCKRPCTTDADCPTNHWCLDDLANSSAPCTDGTCLCKSRPYVGFLDGARLQYGGDLARRDNVITLGNAFGVSEDRTP
jgi:hypothetical protein